MGNVWIALGSTLLAGMATGIGSVLTFAAKSTNYRFLAIAIAIALHNIPEGISVSVPIFGATDDRKKGVCLFHPERPVRAGRCRCRLPGAAPLHERQRRGDPVRGDSHSLRRPRRHHGLHQLGRAPAHEPGLGQRPRQPVWPYRRHGRHGLEPVAPTIGCQEEREENG